MSQNRVFTLETDFLRYGFDEKGRAVEFADRLTGKNYAEPGSPAFALYEGNGDISTGVTLTEKDKASPEEPLKVELNGQTLTVRFAQAEFTLFVQCFSDHVRMTIANVHPADAQFGRFLFGGCVMQDDGMNPEFCGCAVTRSLKGRPLELPGRCERVGVLAYSALSAQGVSAALIGIAPSNLRKAAQNALADCTIDDLLITPYGGPWGADAPGSNSDYIIECSKFDFSNEEWADALLRKNIAQCDFHQGNDYRQGDYVFKPELFPRGAEDFRLTVSDALHRRGMLAGLHTYSGMVDIMSRYVTPIPHPDLYAIAEYTLAEDMTDTDDFIVIEEDVSTVAMNQERPMPVHGATLMIDTELVEFSGKGADRLTGVERGCIGTAVAAHKKGAKVRHLCNMHGYFQCTPGSTLFYELAYNMANAYNVGGFDMMYFDGMECVGRCCTGELEGLGWYYEALFVREVIRTCKRTPLVEYSTFHSSMWGARSRAGAEDAVFTGFKWLMREHFEKNELEGHRRMLPCTLGWWEVYPPSRAPRGERPNWFFKAEYGDDIDYLGSKAIGLKSGLSYLSVPDSTLLDIEQVEFPQYMRLFDRLAEYSRMRDRGYFTDEICRKVSDLDANFRLIEKDGKYGFVRQERLYARPYSLAEGENSVLVSNPFGSQSPMIRLIAQCAAADTEGQVIAKFDREKPLSEQETLIAYPDGLDITGREALGVWVRGTGKDDYLNLRLEGLPPRSTGYSEHIVHLNYEGWRFCMLCDEDTGEYTQLEYAGEEPRSHYVTFLILREQLKHESIGRLRILCTGDMSDVYIGDVCAYPVDDTPVVRPSVSAGGRTVVFDTALQPGSYIEYTPGSGEATVYDIYGHTQKAAAEGDAPVLESGNNEVRLGGTAAGSHRIKMHMIADGEEIFNP